LNTAIRTNTNSVVNWKLQDCCQRVADQWVKQMPGFTGIRDAPIIGR